jgi:membrane protease YdiL (CAAX protease family)
MLLIVLVAGRTGFVGKLELVWFRRGRFETAGILLLPLVAIALITATAALVNGLGLKWRDGHVFSPDGRSVAFFAVLTICWAVAIPILEEVFWRGYVQQGFERIVGAFPAVVCQAVFSAIVHIRPTAGLAPIFVFGLIAGTWRWRRRTLGPIIVAHVVLNGLFCAVHWPHWLDCARIKVATDYVAKMTQGVRPADYDASSDARDCYERASQVVVEMPEMLGQYRRGFPDNWPEGVFEQFRRWVADNEAALGLVTEGARKPYYCPVYTGPTAMLA